MLDYSYISYSPEYLRSRLQSLPHRDLNLANIDDHWIHQYINKPLYDIWVDLRSGQPAAIPSGTLVIDVETTNNTQTLALASCYHWELDTWYYFVSAPGNFDNLLSIPPKSYLIAHRAAFENSFIANNYVPGKPDYASFCTYAYAATRLHPLKPVLFRAMPWLPMFAESSDCSLADLYTWATSKELDKGPVEIFISSAGDQWRKPESVNLLEAGIYNDYLAGRCKDKRLPEKLRKVEVYKYPSVPKIKAEREALRDQLLVDFGSLTHDQKLMLHKLDERAKTANPFVYESQPLDLESYTALLSQTLDIYPHKDRTGLIYNLKDVAATVHVAAKIITDILPDVSDTDFSGIRVRLQPMYALDPDFNDQVQHVEAVFTAHQTKLQSAAELNVHNHLMTSDDWDGQDWKVLRTGRTDWYDTKKIGYQKTLNAIGSRIHWEGNPVKRIEAYKPVKMMDGQYVFPWEGIDKNLLESPETLDLETRRKFWAVEVNPRTDLSYEARMNLMGEFTCLPLENPESVDPKKFLTIVNFFSRGLLKHWKSGSFTCGVPLMQKLIPEYISTSYWKSIRKRFLGIKKVTVDNIQYTSPRPTVHGAVSGRSVDPVFLVLSKYDPDKIGSELAGMFVAPPGYKLVSFDLDSCQARIGAIIADAWYAKRTGSRKVSLGATPISKAVLYGDKKKRTSLAHVLGDTYLGFDLSDPIQADKSYSIGKTAQFSLYFGVGALKLSKSLRVDFDTAQKLCIGWKGIRSPEDKNVYINGTASDLVSAQSALARRYYPVPGDARVWEQHADVIGIVSATKMPHVLNPAYSGNDYITTKYNACIQNGDVAFLNRIVGDVDLHLGVQGLDFRYCSSVHDYFAWFVKDEDVDVFVSVIKEVHKQCYVDFLTAWNVDFASVPVDMWYPSTVDVTQRFVKAEKDELRANSRTVSFDGYNEDIWTDVTVDWEEYDGLEEEEV